MLADSSPPFLGLSSAVLLGDLGELALLIRGEDLRATDALLDATDAEAEGIRLGLLPNSP